MVGCFPNSFIRKEWRQKAKASLQVYNSLVDELEVYDPALFFTKRAHNTVNKKMKNIKMFLKKTCVQEILIKMMRSPG